MVKKKPDWPKADPDTAQTPIYDRVIESVKKKKKREEKNK